MAKSQILEVTAFHRDVFAIISRAHTQALTTAQRMAQLLATKYGAPIKGKDAAGKDTLSGGPSFEQYRGDQAALREIATERKLKDAQWLRKSYAKAVRETYGKLPEAQTAEAIAKRAQRAAAEAAAATNPPAPTADKGKAGAPFGMVQDHGQSAAETVESVVTRLGLFNTGFAIVRILESDDSTKAQALHLRKMFEAAQDAYTKAKNPTAEETKVKTVRRVKKAA